MATNSSFTLVAVLADVSMKKMPLSDAYDSASCRHRETEALLLSTRALRDGSISSEQGPRDGVTTWPSLGVVDADEVGRSAEMGNQASARTSGSTLRLELRSDLLPASAMTMFGLPCRCSSLTHCLARWKVSCCWCGSRVVS